MQVTATHILENILYFLPRCSALAQCLEDSLECPVCLEPARGELYQCHRSMGDLNTFLPLTLIPFHHARLFFLFPLLLFHFLAFSFHLLFFPLPPFRSGLMLPYPRGHILCLSCRWRLWSCPVCRAPLSLPPIR